MKFRLDDSARDEVIEATAWYADRDPAAARRFVKEMDTALKRIAESPDTLPLLETWQRPEPIRRILLQSFPFVIVFERVLDEIVVWAVTHTCRRPLHWQHRRKT